MPTLFIDEHSGLIRLCERLRASPWIVLDTEFVRESTYYAKLGLLQVANEEIVACVDPFAVDLSPLLDVLYTPSILKVLHAGRQDLEVLYDLRGTVPRPLFDTQIAGALLGYPAQMGYGALVEAVTGVKLSKLHTRTNWEARPLSDEQLAYAADDVIYLRDVYRGLHKQLEARNRLDWLTEECDALADPMLYRNEPESAYERLNNGHTVIPAAQPLLKALATWRERTAQTRNRPRSWIAPDLLLIEIAKTAPVDLDSLRRLPSITPSFVETHGLDILTVVKNTKGAAPDSLWVEPKPLSTSEKELVRHLLNRIQTVAHARQINPEIIATRRTVLALIRERAGPLMRGWRYVLIGRELSTALN